MVRSVQIWKKHHVNYPESRPPNLVTHIILKETDIRADLSVVIRVLLELALHHVVHAANQRGGLANATVAVYTVVWCRVETS